MYVLCTTDTTTEGSNLIEDVSATRARTKKGGGNRNLDEKKGGILIAVS